MPGPRYVVQAVPMSEFQVWDTRAQAIAYLPRTLSETTQSRVQAENYASRLNECSSAQELGRDFHDPQNYHAIRD
jgi:hypothetical protein